MQRFKPLSSSLIQGLKNTNQNISRMNSGGFNSNNSNSPNPMGGPAGGPQRYAPRIEDSNSMYALQKLVPPILNEFQGGIRGPFMQAFNWEDYQNQHPTKLIPSISNELGQGDTSPLPPQPLPPSPLPIGVGAGMKPPVDPGIMSSGQGGQGTGSQQGGQNVMGGSGFGPGSESMGTYDAGWGEGASESGAGISGGMEFDQGLGLGSGSAGGGHLGFGGSMGGDAHDEWVESGEQEEAHLYAQGVYTLPGGGYTISNMYGLYSPEVLAQAGLPTSGQYTFDNPQHALETIAYLQNLQQLYESGFYDELVPGVGDPIEGLTGGFDSGDFNLGSGFGSGGFNFNSSDFGPTNWSNLDWSNIDYNDFSAGASNMRNQMFGGGAGISAGINTGSAGRRLDYASGGGKTSAGFSSQGKNIETPLDSLVRKYSSVGETI